MSFIYINERYWPFEAIQNSSINEWQTYPAFERYILEAARQWLSGQKTFQLQTSGSTGKPRGFSFSREQIQRSVQQTADTFGLVQGEALLNPLSIESVAGFMMLMRGLVCRMPVYCVEPGRAPLPEALRDCAFSFAAFVPLQLKTLLARGYAPSLNAIKTIITGGGPVNAELEQAVRQLTTTVYHTYGMTETLTHVATRQLCPERKSAYTGVAGVHFEQTAEACLLIHTPLWQEPVATNDRIRLIDSHHFEWLGRLDWVINSGGYKIQVEQAEDRIAAAFQDHWSAVPEFFLFGTPDEALGERAVLIIKTADPLDENARNALLSTLKGYLHSYAVPKALFDLRTFQYTPSGKLDRKGTIAGNGISQQT